MCRLTIYEMIFYEEGLPFIVPGTMTLHSPVTDIAHGRHHLPVIFLRRLITTSQLSNGSTIYYSGRCGKNN